MRHFHVVERPRLRSNASLLPVRSHVPLRIRVWDKKADRVDQRRKRQRSKVKSQRSLPPVNSVPARPDRCLGPQTPVVSAGNRAADGVRQVWAVRHHQVQTHAAVNCCPDSCLPCHGRLHCPGCCDWSQRPPESVCSDAAQRCDSWTS